VYKCQSSDSLPLISFFPDAQEKVLQIPEINKETYCFRPSGGDREMHLTAAFEKLILSELRLTAYAAGGADCQPADDKIVQAMTVNEELRNLGYTLTPADLMRLACSPSLEGFAQHFRSLLPEVAAPPMYPDFPLQVMRMDEAEFRLHQMIHYFSTYDLEWITGKQVKRGWLPDVEAAEKTESDDTLLKAKVLELVPEEAAPITALTRIMSRRERLTLPGRALTVEALAYLQPEDLAGLKVPFKENLTELFDAILRSAPNHRRIPMWRQICQHTGDVIKSVNAILPRYRYHFRTSQKRAIVKLLESYPAVDFKANLILSRGKREKSLTVLQYLDYNMYSRSEAHKEAVRALRNGELRSWEAQAKYLLASEAYSAQAGELPGSDETYSAQTGDLPGSENIYNAQAVEQPGQPATGEEGALDFIAKRPGMMLRMISWLLRLGYKDEEIRNRLVQNAGAISSHTVVDILNALDLKEEDAPLESVYLALRKIEEGHRKHFAAVIENPGNFFTQYMISKGYFEDELRVARNRERYYRQRIAELDREYEAACDLYRRTAPYTDRVRAILMDVLRAHLEKAQTELAGKKVFLKLDGYDPAYCRLEAGRKSDEGGYLPSGMAIRIPEEVRRLRFFVYWNDRERVDVDLHAMAYSLDGEGIHVGWNAAFNKSGIVHSGDITHSNAAEYIDIDMGAPLRHAEAVIHLYYGKPSFGKIQTCYVGMMAVKRFKEKVKLYDPKNCFFTHELRSEGRELSYGYVDVQRRLLFFTGKEPEKGSRFAAARGMYRANAPYLSLKKYLELLIEAQNAAVTDREEEADLILTIGKSADAKAVSLADRNFWLEA